MTESPCRPAERPRRNGVSLVLDRLAEGLALLGGAVLLALVAMSLYAVVTRKLGVAVFAGDIEMMQMGMAVATACFLPVCTSRGGQLKVEFFTEGCSPRLRERLDALADLLLAAVMGVLAWRTGLQALEAADMGGVSSLLSVPLWIPTAGTLPGLAVACLCALDRMALELAGKGGVA